MRRLLKTSEVVSQLGISEQAVRQLIRADILEAAKVGNRWRIFPESLELYCELRQDPDIEGR